MEETGLSKSQNLLDGTDSLLSRHGRQRRGKRFPH